LCCVRHKHKKKIPGRGYPKGGGSYSGEGKGLGGLSRASSPLCIQNLKSIGSAVQQIRGLSQLQTKSQNHRQTDRTTDITAGFNIASFAFIVGRMQKSYKNPTMYVFQYIKLTCRPNMSHIGILLTVNSADFLARSRHIV